MKRLFLLIALISALLFSRSEKVSHAQRCGDPNFCYSGWVTIMYWQQTAPFCIHVWYQDTCYDENPPRVSETYDHQYSGGGCELLY
jgi:hypothetical protein